MKRSTWIAAAVMTSLVWMPTSGASAEDFSGGVKLGMDPTPIEAQAFASYAEALERSGSEQVRKLGSMARETLDAASSGDVEAFIAAKAIFDYRHQTLTNDASRELDSIHSRLSAPLELPTLPDWAGPQKVSVTFGCGSELACNNGSRISCTCANSNGTCSYNPTANSWGGSITCNCAGTTYDTTKSCPYAGPTCSARDCDIQCGGVGYGRCINNQCVCI